MHPIPALGLKEKDSLQDLVSRFTRKVLDFDFERELFRERKNEQLVVLMVAVLVSILFIYAYTNL